MTQAKLQERPPMRSVSALPPEEGIDDYDIKQGLHSPYRTPRRDDDGRRKNKTEGTTSKPANHAETLRSIKRKTPNKPC